MIDESEEFWASDDSLNNLGEKVKIMKEELQENANVLLNLTLGSHRRSFSTENHKNQAKKKRKLNLVLPKIKAGKQLPLESVHQPHLLTDKVHNTQTYLDSRISTRKKHKTLAGLYVPPQKHMVLGLSYKKSKPKTSRISPRNVNVKNPDWADSPLNSKINTGNSKFNEKNDPSFFTLKQFIKMKESSSQHILPDKIIRKLIKTIEILKEELYTGNYIQYHLNAKSILTACSQLFDIRKITVEILVAVHQWESISFRSPLGNQNRHVLLISKILSLISNWKDLNIPFDKFVYKGSNLELKLQDCLDRFNNKISF